MNGYEDRIIAFQGIDNVRDLGGIPVGADRSVKFGLIYRGAALHAATETDMRKLTEELGVSCVVDVRCGWERAGKPDVFHPGIDSLHIPFYDKEIVGIEYTEPGSEGKVVSRDVPCTPILFYPSLTNTLTSAQMAKAAKVVLERAVAGKTTYIHCNGGKDRIGILSLLILSVLGVDKEEIMRDYLLTNVSRDGQYPELYVRFYELCHDEERAHELVLTHRALPEYVEAFYEALDRDHGGMDGFIENVMKLDADEVEQIRAVCTQSR